MKLSERTLRISGASLIALLMIGGAYFLSGPSFLSSRIAGAESTEALLAAYATKDTDADGLPDWQETLYGTDPSQQDTDKDGVSDGEAVRQGLVKPNALAAQLPQDPEGEEVAEQLPGIDPAPGSITERFARSFFEQFAAASNGLPMDDATRQQLISNLLTDITGTVSHELESKYSTVSVRTSSSVSVLEYAGAVEAVILANDVPEGANDPLVLMQQLIEDGDESARTKLEALAGSYRSIAIGLSEVRVPPSLAEDHALLVRSFDSLFRATRMVASFDKDPLGTLGALALYQPSADGMVQAFRSMSVVILRQGEPTEGAPGAIIVNVVRSAEQQVGI